MRRAISTLLYFGAPSFPWNRSFHLRVVGGIRRTFKDFPNFLIQNCSRESAAARETNSRGIIPKVCGPRLNISGYSFPKPRTPRFPNKVCQDLPHRALSKHTGKWFFRRIPQAWGAVKEGWPRNPPLPRVFLLLYVTTAPEDFEQKHLPSKPLLRGTLGPGLVIPNFGVFLETPFWAGIPLGTPLPSPLTGQEPPFLDPSYDPSCPEAIAHKSLCWGLNRIVPLH